MRNARGGHQTFSLVLAGAVTPGSLSRYPPEIGLSLRDRSHRVLTGGKMSRPDIFNNAPSFEPVGVEPDVDLVAGGLHALQRRRIALVGRLQAALGRVGAIRLVADRAGIRVAGGRAGGSGQAGERRGG